LVCFCAHTNPTGQMDQFEAARVGDHQQLRRVLTAHNVDNVSATYGYTALYCAALFGQVECAKVCIEMGANVSARTHRQQTPLHGAASGNVEIARMLLDAGAIVDAKDCDGCTPLYSAFFSNHNC
jgi:ankyrin repeat protein